MANEVKAGHGHGHDEVVVNETTPQGTQQNAVEYGHEERDIFVGSIMRWLVGVGIGTGIIIAFLVGLFGFMNRHYAYQDDMPSPLYRANQLPPTPRIEGFMTQDERGELGVTPDGTKSPRAGTPEELEVVRATERQKLESFGLKQDDDKEDDPGDSDRYGYYHPLKISPDMVSKVGSESNSYIPPMSSSMALKVRPANSEAEFVKDTPSDASGGLVDNPNRYVDTSPKLKDPR